MLLYYSLFSFCLSNSFISFNNIIIFPSYHCLFSFAHHILFPSLPSLPPSLPSFRYLFIFLPPSHSLLFLSLPLPLSTSLFLSFPPLSFSPNSPSLLQPISPFPFTSSLHLLLSLSLPLLLFIIQSPPVL